MRVDKQYLEDVENVIKVMHKNASYWDMYSFDLVFEKIPDLIQAVRERQKIIEEFADCWPNELGLCTYCGGHEKLNQEISHFPNCPWLKAKQLTKC